jgi:hypothetical protein
LYVPRSFDAGLVEAGDQRCVPVDPAPEPGTGIDEDPGFVGSSVHASGSERCVWPPFWFEPYGDSDTTERVYADPSGIVRYRVRAWWPLAKVWLLVLPLPFALLGFFGLRIARHRRGRPVTLARLVDATDAGFRGSAKPRWEATPLDGSPVRLAELDERLVETDPTMEAARGARTIDRPVLLVEHPGEPAVAVESESELHAGVVFVVDDVVLALLDAPGTRRLAAGETPASPSAESLAAARDNEPIPLGRAVYRIRDRLVGVAIIGVGTWAVGFGLVVLQPYAPILGRTPVGLATIVLGGALVGVLAAFLMPFRRRPKTDILD